MQEEAEEADGVLPGDFVVSEPVASFLHVRYALRRRVEEVQCFFDAVYVPVVMVVVHLTHTEELRVLLVSDKAPGTGQVCMFK